MGGSLDCKNSSNFAADYLVKNSSLYREYKLECDEILKHKWLESEKAGYDIGFERALIDWIIKHRKNWRRGRERENHLEQIKQKGIDVAVFSNLKDFSYHRTLPVSEYQTIKGLTEIVGLYEYSPPSNALRKISVSPHSSIQGGIFANEYKEGDERYRIHFHTDLEITVSRDQEGELKIEEVRCE